MYFVIVSFAGKETERLYVTGKSRRFPASIGKTSLRKLDYLNRAKVLQDLQAPPGNHLEALKGDLKGKYSIRINPCELESPGSRRGRNAEFAGGRVMSPDQSGYRWGLHCTVPDHISLQRWRCIGG